MKREAVIAGLASEGLLMISGSAAFLFFCFYTFLLIQPFPHFFFYGSTRKLFDLENRKTKNDHAARYSRAPRQLQMHALDLLSSPC